MRTSIYQSVIIILSLILMSCGATPDARASNEGDLVVTLLGTGTPGLNPNRFSASNLVQAGGMNLLFDAGRGASIRLGQMDESPGAVDAVFITHFHSDHVNGLADIFLSGYITASSLRSRVEKFQLYGPKGTQKLANGLLLAHDWDIKTRILDEKVSERATQIDVFEIESGIVFERKGVTVTVFEVNHGDNISPAVGYRVDYKGKSVVFSGDTTYDPNLIKFGKGADLLIHEVGMATPELAKKATIQRIIAHHTSPEDVGRIFAQASPKLAVYSHMVLLGRPPIADVIEKTRKTYDGPLVIGEDLMQFIISDNGVTILKAG